MKNPLQGVIVEYKGARRARNMTKPNALWGNIDLKTIAREVESDSRLTGNETVSEVEPSDATTAVLTMASPAEPVPSVADPASVAAKDATKPSETDPLPARHLSEKSKPSRSGGKRETVRAPRVKKTSVKQQAVVAALPLPVAVPIGDEIIALEAENAALKHQLIEKLRRENAQLIHMLKRVNQTSLR